MTPKQIRWRNRIIVALALFALAYAAAELLPLESRLGSKQAALAAEFALFAVPYLVAGYDVLLRAGRNIARGQVFDENFLMSVATIGAFALVLFPDTDPHMAEGAAVMLFYQVGELFQSYAVGKSRRSIADMMDIAPEYANVEREGRLLQVDPYEVSPGDEIIIKPGERVPLDGVVLRGESQLDTAALTGESLPRSVRPDDEVVSGCVNMTGALTVRVSKPYEDSTVSRILELVENAADKKAKTESFITRFARYYTPVVVAVALLLAVIPPLLLGQSWSSWVQRGLIFLVVSCPCALVISVPLSFFGGIGGASRAGILVKGSNYLEALASADTVVFDKTGTLTSGSFAVVSLEPEEGVSEEELLEVAAHAEANSDHPIARSVREAYAAELQRDRVTEAGELGGHGVRALVDGRAALVGNDKLMNAHGVAMGGCAETEPGAEVGVQVSVDPTLRIDTAENAGVSGSTSPADNASPEPVATGTVLHVALERRYLGRIVIADAVKPDAAQAVSDLRKLGVKRTVMLTGDKRDVARSVAEKLGIGEYRAELLPQDKVAEVERLLEAEEAAGGKGKLAFVGDGINDAPVLARADIGIAMGAMGSDAAIEAADVVLMDDRPENIARAIRIARKTMRIVRQNIVFALGVKLTVLLLAAAGLANMWLAVFADVGVAMLAILNAMRAMRVGGKQR